MTSPLETAATQAGESLARRYAAIRRATAQLCEPLQTEDFVVQSMPDASPVRWHLAHTTWFFETFVLGQALRGFRPFDPAFAQLFNSYYNSVGEPFPRQNRGLLTRPTVREVLGYRAAVDERMAGLLLELLELRGSRDDDVLYAIEVGLQHEQQHQELILTDLKHLFSCNPLAPVYRERGVEAVAPPEPARWSRHAEGLAWLGHGGEDFCFDNERPRHRTFVQEFELAGRLITNGEFIGFIQDGGYARPEHWLAAGWAAVRGGGWRAPLYWEERSTGEWWNFTLSGLRPVAAAEPVCHVSYYEADAFARWAGARLPTEAEWELAAAAVPLEGNFVESGALHPVRASGSALPGSALPLQMFGDAWEWTSSWYAAYPGYRPPAGPLGEYNGKFMSGQMVLRGGSCATPRSHIRPTYRNFFPPDARWQWSGIRLARDIGRTG